MSAPITTLLLSAAMPLFAAPEPLLEAGSFEWPPVIKRKARAEGADVSKSAMAAEWVKFTDKADAAGGRLVLGLTNEQFRTGRQCLFVQFDRLTKPGAAAELMSDMVSIKPGETYHVSIWGRMDRKDPLTLEGRIPFLKLRVDWFAADREVQVGEVINRIQSIPGTRNRPPMFSSTKWTEYFADVKSPAEAAFMRVTWAWESPLEAGETHGTAYFDDAGIHGESGPKSDPLAELEMENAAAEAEAAAPAAAAVAQPAPVPPPPPKKPGLEILATPLSTPVPQPPAPEKKKPR